jgi:xanthine dehydrogenase YagS FAD-binding subunit
MRDFAFARAASGDAAVAALEKPSTVLIAGGTELLNWMRLGIAEPERVLDIARLGMNEIRREDDVLRVGARVTLNELGEHPLILDHATVLAEAALAAASPQIRNRATSGGNILQKTRCAYFRAEHPLPWACNKRAPGSGCAAREGNTERLAIFGWTEACVATQPSDPAVALACLDAEVDVLGPSGAHAISMRAFHLSQADARAAGLDEATAETQLRGDELITGFRIPIRPGERSAYVKVRERASYEYALVSAAATVAVRAGKIAAARVALGSVAQRPWRLPDAELELVGKPVERGAIAAAIAIAMSEARPLSQNGYKVSMAANAATRAVLMAASR